MPGGLLGPAPIHGGLLGDPRRDRLAREMTHQANTRPRMGLLDALALATSPVPVVGDLTGLAADARMYAQEPQSRTWGNFAMTAAGALPFVPGAVAGTLRTANKVTDAMPGKPPITLYHGSPSPIAEIDDRFPFGGIFAAGKESALSHGGVLHRVDVPAGGVLDQRTLDFDLDPGEVDTALKGAAHWMSDDDLAIARDFIVGDKNLFDSAVDQDELLRVFKADDLGEASWEAQRLRGQIAKRLGFKAVEMSDEHGTSYLILPGVPIRPDK